MQPQTRQTGSVISTQLKLRLGKARTRGEPMAKTPEKLPEIPVIDTGPAFPLETLVGNERHAHALLDCATQGVPRVVLRALDAMSRRWLVKQGNASLEEIDALARHMNRPGCHFLSVNYEWGCTVGVGPSPDGRSARLTRTLDWFTPGLGRYVIAARVQGAAGPFVTMAWPGFVGVLQAMAPGRFSASINQAPLRRAGGGLFPLDWAAAKAHTWRRPHVPALHLLRTVFETARDYDEARRLLIETPIATPATFSLAGIAPHETCVIERAEQRAFTFDGATCTTNHWRGLDHGGHSRGIDSEGRLASMRKAGATEFDGTFPWLRYPVLNELTRLAMVADAANGRIIAQGYEDGHPATKVLDVTMPRAAAIGFAAE